MNNLLLEKIASRLSSNLRSIAHDTKYLKNEQKHELLRRRLNIANDLGAGPSKALSENYGQVTSKILPILIGGVAGSAVGGGAGGVLGALAGYGSTKLTDIVMSMAGEYSQRRSMQDQKEYEHSGKDTILNYLVPGMAAYNKEKSMRLVYNTPQLQGAVTNAI